MEKMSLYTTAVLNVFADVQKIDLTLILNIKYLMLIQRVGNMAGRILTNGNVGHGRYTQHLVPSR